MAEAYEYLVKTLFLANFIDAATGVAVERRKPTDKDSLLNALKRMDFADRMLERELNTYGMAGYKLVDTIHHVLADQPGDLLVTAIFMRQLEEGDDESSDVSETNTENSAGGSDGAAAYPSSYPPAPLPLE